MVDCSANAAGDDCVLAVKGGAQVHDPDRRRGGSGGPLNCRSTTSRTVIGTAQFDELDECPTVAGIERFDGCPPELSSRPRLDVRPNTAGGIRITRL